MHKTIAITLLITALLFLIFVSPPQLGIVFLVAGGIMYLFGNKILHERGEK